MTRFTTLVFVSMVAACSWGDGSGSGDDDGGSDAGLPNTPVCGDGMCSSSEVNSCQADCGGGGATNPVCGDGSCTGTETANSCPSDCTSGNPGGSGSNAACPADLLECIGCFIGTCPAGHTQDSCIACAIGGGGIPGFGDIGCTGMAADGTCDTMEMGLGSDVCSDCP
jgi:hypothetical protein